MEGDLGRGAKESTNLGRPFRNLLRVQARGRGGWIWDVTVGKEVQVLYMCPDGEPTGHFGELGMECEGKKDQDGGSGFEQGGR